MTDNDYTIETKVGTIKVHVTNGKYVVASFTDLTIYRVTHSGSLRLELAAEGWRPEREKNGNDFYALHINSRWDGTKHIEPSYAARDKIKALLIPEIAKWLHAHPEALQAGRQAEKDRKVSQAESKIAELKTKLKEAEAELAAAQRIQV